MKTQDLMKNNNDYLVNIVFKNNSDNRILTSEYVT